MKQLWQTWLTNNYHFTKENSDYRRVVVLNFTLSMMIIVLSIYCLFNFIYNPDSLMGYFQLGAIFLTGIVLLIFKLNNNIMFASICGEGLLIAVIISIMIIDHNEYYVFMWAFLVPAISYFILGRIPGSFISFGFMVVLVILLIYFPPTFVPDAFDVNSLSNIIGAFFVGALVIRYYELSRADTLEELRDINTKLKRLSETDKLTRLYNRLRLDEALEKQIMHAENSKKPLTVIMIDVDDFKKINDEFGHLVGDTVLMETAYLLRKNLPRDHIVGRWGGEEFLIICPHTDSEEAYDLSDSLRTIIANYSFDGKIKVTISLGLGTWSPGDTHETIIRKADRALYEAKDIGKNIVKS